MSPERQKAELSEHSQTETIQQRQSIGGFVRWITLAIVAKIALVVGGEPTGGLTLLSGVALIAATLRLIQAVAIGSGGRFRAAYTRLFGDPTRLNSTVQERDTE